MKLGHRQALVPVSSTPEMTLSAMLPAITGKGDFKVSLCNNGQIDLRIVDGFGKTIACAFICPLYVIRDFCSMTGKFGRDLRRGLTSKIVISPSLFDKRNAKAFSLNVIVDVRLRHREAAVAK